MLYWGLKVDKKIIKIISSEIKSNISDFGLPYVKNASVVRIDVRIRNCIKSPQADEKNPYFSVDNKHDNHGNETRHLWWGLKVGLDVISLILSQERPHIGEFGVNIYGRNQEVVRVEIKESCDYGELNWQLIPAD
ncbi:MAG: hypothetical protein QM500_08810 [Methylococcales bacterium]